ncbi:hypothetical protein F4775DRAFT_574977 [Biscogniauxia sp. FL1348]|nr:hypothetical protein F4775DRAFT_574977 [Biscogniauxia sp. FL1348]
MFKKPDHCHTFFFSFLSFLISLPRLFAVASLGFFFCLVLTLFYLVPFLGVFFLPPSPIFLLFSRRHWSLFFFLAQAQRVSFWPGLPSFFFFLFFFLLESQILLLIDVPPFVLNSIPHSF